MLPPAPAKWKVPRPRSGPGHFSVASPRLIGAPRPRSESCPGGPLRISMTKNHGKSMQAVLPARSHDYKTLLSESVWNIIRSFSWWIKHYFLSHASFIMCLLLHSFRLQFHCPWIGELDHHRYYNREKYFKDAEKRRKVAPKCCF